MRLFRSIFKTSSSTAGAWRMAQWSSFFENISPTYMGSGVWYAPSYGSSQFLPGPGPAALATGSAPR